MVVCCLQLLEMAVKTNFIVAAAIHKQVVIQII